MKILILFQENKINKKIIKDLLFRKMNILLLIINQKKITWTNKKNFNLRNHNQQLNFYLNGSTAETIKISESLKV